MRDQKVESYSAFRNLIKTAISAKYGHVSLCLFSFFYIYQAAFQTLTEINRGFGYKETVPP